MAKILKITLFVNPHKFYYIEDEADNEGYNKQLDDLEHKIKGSLYKNSQTPNAEGQDEIQVMDTVAVFMRDWHKWVRGVVKAKNRNGSFHVWVIDYGIPVVSTPSQTVKLQDNYAKMNMKNPRVRLGGLANCIPAENKYDFDQNTMIFVEKQHWSPNAISIAQDSIRRAVQLKFEIDRELKMVNGPHVFGYLKIQKADGSWADLASCLSNACVAKIPNDNWVNRVNNLDTIKQKEWMSVDGEPLHARVDVSSILLRSDDAENRSQANYNTAEYEAPFETKRRNDDRARTPDSRSFQKRSSSNTRSTNQNARGFSTFRSRQYNRSDSSSEYAYNGRPNERKYRDEGNFFEKHFGLRSMPNKKEDSSLENSTLKPNEDETGKLIETVNVQHQTKDDTDNNGQNQQQAHKVNTVSDSNAASADEKENASNDKQTYQTESVDDVSTDKQASKLKPVNVAMASNGVANEQMGNVAETKPNKEIGQLDGRLESNNIEMNITGTPKTVDTGDNSIITNREKKHTVANTDENLHEITI